jgi:hypothetical protein
MLYFANPCGPDVAALMADQALGFIDTPLQGNRRPDGVMWCADNGCFSAKWDADRWWAWLVANAGHAGSCRFAVAPDVVGDHEATMVRSSPWLPKIRALGYPAAFVLQDGAHDLPWDAFDVLFIGGSTAYKLSPEAAAFAADAKAHGKWVHMGRVNSFRRIEYAAWIGCDSADGTYLTFGPDTNLPKLTSWLHRLDTQRFLGEAS